MVDFSGAANIFRRIKRAVSPAAEVASNKMADEYKAYVKWELSLFPHAAHTRTPSPPGAPPGMISSALRDSVLATPAIPIGPAIWQSSVGPHTIYAAIQEFGGVMHAHGDYMSWITDGTRYYKKTVVLPPRPYMRPAAEKLGKSGQLTRTAANGIASVLYTVE